MGYIPRRNLGGSPLPPPPAPPSRDANPWTMTSGRVLRPSPASRAAAATPRPGAPPSGAPTPASSGAPGPSSRARLIPLAILGGVLLAVGGNAIEAFLRGDYVGALVPLVFVGFVAVGVVRGLRHRPR